MNGPDLAEELRAEIGGIRETLLRLVEVQACVADRQPTHVELTAMAAYLANLYAGLERVLLRVARHSGLPHPDGPSWHRDLLELFRSRATSQLPFQLEEGLFGELAPYLGFRHLFAHAYAVRLDWTLMKEAVEAAPALFARLLDTIDAFAETVSHSSG